VQDLAQGDRAETPDIALCSAAVRVIAAEVEEVIDLSGFQDPKIRDLGRNLLHGFAMNSIPTASRPHPTNR
jgi:hypothetical protein